MITAGGAFVGAIMILILAFGLWLQQRHPREIVATSRISVDSRTRPGVPLKLAVRRVWIAAHEFSEVRMPNGTWIDCAADCRKAALDAGPEFWDEQARDRGR